MSLDHACQTGRATLVDRKDDLYETPDVAVHALMRVEPLPRVIWECACGPGRIVNVLRGAGHFVYATDLVDYGCPDSTPRADFHVYALIDPRIGRPFYIGITGDRKGRFRNHRKDAYGATYHRISEIEAVGLKAEMQTLATYWARDKAIAHEARLISTLPDLVNRDRPRDVA